MGLIDSTANGATEIPGTSNNSLFVAFLGPIRYWWTPGVWDTRLHKVYMNTREKVHLSLSDDFLVYAPYRAWRGPWNEVAQKINDQAIILCDAVVWLRVDGVLAHGTDEELLLARDMHKPSFDIPVGDSYNTWAALDAVKAQLNILEVELGKC